MEFTNYLGHVKESGSASEKAWKGAIKALLLLIAPTAPHLAEELWQGCGYEYSIHDQDWPAWDEALVTRDEIVVPVQINGKMRDTITVPASTTEVEVRQIAAESTRVRPYLEGKQVVKVIYVPGKIINFVVK